MCKTEGFWILTRDIASKLFHSELHLEGTSKGSGCWSHCAHIINGLPESPVTHCLPAGNWFSSAAVFTFYCLAHVLGLNRNKNNDTLTLLGLLFPPVPTCLEFRNHTCSWLLDLTLVLQNTAQLIHYFIFRGLWQPPLQCLSSMWCSLQHAGIKRIKRNISISTQLWGKIFQFRSFP